MNAAMPDATITIRPARPEDARQLRRVVELDSATLPGGELLVGEANGEILAAVSLADARTIADPFRPTADMVELLRARAAQLRRISKFSRPPCRRALAPGVLRQALGNLVPRRVGSVVGDRR